MKNAVALAVVAAAGVASAQPSEVATISTSFLVTSLDYSTTFAQGDGDLAVDVTGLELPQSFIVLFSAAIDTNFTAGEFSGFDLQLGQEGGVSRALDASGNPAPPTFPQLAGNADLLAFLNDGAVAVSSAANFTDVGFAGLPQIPLNSEGDTTFVVGNIVSVEGFGSLSFSFDAIGLGPDGISSFIGSSDSTLSFVPTPASAALLGLGGLAAARRRR